MIFIKPGKDGPGWCTARASSIDEKGLIGLSLRQHPPRLVRVLLVYTYINSQYVYYNAN